MEHITNLIHAIEQEKFNTKVILRASTKRRATYEKHAIRAIMVNVR